MMEQRAATPEIYIARERDEDRRLKTICVIPMGNPHGGENLNNDRITPPAKIVSELDRFIMRPERRAKHEPWPWPCANRCRQLGR